MTKQAVTLGDLVGQLGRLEIRCKRCNRQGRVRLTKLIAEHGAALGYLSWPCSLRLTAPRLQLRTKPTAVSSTSRSWPGRCRQAEGARGVSTGGNPSGTGCRRLV